MHLQLSAKEALEGELQPNADRSVAALIVESFVVPGRCKRERSSKLTSTRTVECELAEAMCGFMN
jgi:hypothetical protein